MTKKMQILIVLLSSVLLTGCTEMMMEVAANSFPTYDETIKIWPEIPSDQGRIVIFTPTKNPIFSYCEITIDRVEYKGMLEGTFIFVDVKIGVHALACSNNNYPDFNLNIESGDIVYVKKFKSIQGKSPFIVIEEPDVYDNLKNVNHAFEDAIPYDKQPLVVKHREGS